MIYKWEHSVIQGNFIEIQINFGSSYLQLRFDGEIDYRQGKERVNTDYCWIEL